ncbi:hypothetical protein [Neotabrizicola sp. VNH66]|uniref:hypothetical protein n=1 Tax=Neotabrizicola sp. VNH66 TaxID=3400918 RepID=UPI003BFD3BEE
MSAPPHITTEAALDAAARMIAELVQGLVKTPEGREEVVLEMIAQLSRSKAKDEAEVEILRRVVERMRVQG